MTAHAQPMDERLRAWLEQHRLIGGGRLPSERSLAQVLGCSRRQARSALQLLAEQGVVRQPTARTRIVAPNDLGRGEALANTVILLATPADLPSAGTNRYLGLYQHVYLHVSRALERAGLSQLTMPADALMRERVCQLLMRRPAGFIMLFGASRLTGGQAVLDSAHHAGVPAVICGDELHADEIARSGADIVGFDHHAGVRAIIDRAVADGHRRFLRIRGWNPAQRACAWHVHQEEGWRAGLLAHGLIAPESIEIAIPDESAALDPDHHRPRICAGYIAEHVLSRYPPTAFIASSDSLVPELGLACRLLGREVAYYGYDNLHDHPVVGPRMRTTGFRPTATIDLDPQALAEMTVNLLCDRRSGRLNGAQVERLSPVRLIVG